MKKLKKLILLSILLFGISFIVVVNHSQALAEKYKTYEDFIYTEDEDSISIVGLSDQTIIETVIPEQINGKTVDSISSEFANFNTNGTIKLKKLTIPSTIKRIGNDTYEIFKNAIDLEEFVVDPENQYFCSVDGVLYTKDKTELVAYPANKAGNIYNILNTVTRIQAYAFAASRNLDVINIPNSVKEIGQLCFAESSIKSLTVPETVEKVESSFCEKCPNLTTVEYNADIYVNLDAFYKCLNLTTVTLGDKCTSIRSGAFYGCEKLANVNFETCKLVSIDYEAFEECPSLPRTIKMTETMKHMEKTSFDSDVKIEFINEDMLELKDGWELCADIKVNGTQKYTDAYKVFDLTNAQRKNAGLTELKLDKNLMDIAMQRAYEISVYYAHRRPEVYRGFALGAPDYDARIFMEDTLYRMGLYGEITFSAENIAKGYTSSEDVVKGWMNSSGHKANILGDYTTIGVGAVKTDYGYFWVQIFGTDTYTKEETRSDKTETRLIPVSSGSYINSFDPDKGLLIELYNGTNKVDVGDTEKIKIISNFYYNNATTYIDPSSFTWSSSNNKILKVDENGNVTGISPGTANVILKMSDGNTISYEVTVENTLLKGDVNKDGKIRLYDALQILKQSILGGNLSEEMLYIMDYNDDGKVKLYDALKFLQQAILG